MRCNKPIRHVKALAVRLPLLFTSGAIIVNTIIFGAIWRDLARFRDFQRYNMDPKETKILKILEDAHEGASTDEINKDF